MRTRPSFPNSVWTGETGNREGPNDDIDPNSEDWDRIRDEVIAIQAYTQQQYLTTVAGEDIPHSRLIRIGVDGLARLATPSQPEVVGLSLHSASAFDSMQYTPEGTTLSLSLPDGQYFLSNDGTLSLTPAIFGYAVKVGRVAGGVFYFRVHDSVRL